MEKNWKKTVISPDASVKEALKIIDSEALRVALVVDEEFNLIGVVTDGDIRRAFLNGLGLDSLVKEVMNNAPVTALHGQDRTSLIDKMKELDVLSIPLLDNGKLVGLETLHHALVDKTKFQNPIFIMAGGFGTRLRPLTDDCPKPMLKVGARPILETVVRSFIKAGFVNFYISTHYMPEQIRSHFGDGSDYGIKIRYVHEQEPLGTGGALGLLPKDLDLPLIMINGDVLTNVDFQKLLEFHNENQADATMCVREYDYQVPYGVISGEGNKITAMVEKPVQRFFVNAGIYVVSPNVYRSVPENHRIDMPSLLEQHIAEDDSVLMFPVHEYWLDIGRMEDFKKAQIDIHNLGFNF